MKIHVICALLLIFLLLVSGCNDTTHSSLQTTIPTPSPRITLTTTTTSNRPSTSRITLITTATTTPTVSDTVKPYFLSSGEMIVSYIDVGQGDSELIQFPSGKIMLIDAGPPSAGSIVASYLRSKGISSIDIVVASHPHEDHIGGMSTILNSFTVKKFIDSGYPHTTSTYENMLNLIDSKNIPFRTVAEGDSIDLDPEVSITVLNPQSTFSDDINQNSVALKMTYEKVSFLFPGDAGGIMDHADILKVSHHGSNTGLSSISEVDPSVSVIEVGVNSYGHPTSAVLQRLEQVGSKIYRTDLDGTITIISDGETYSVSPTKIRQVTTSVIPTMTTIKTTSTTLIPTSKIQYTITTKLATGGTGTCDCSRNVYNCADFPLQNGMSAQECYNYCISLGKGDIHGLDRDKDGLACES